MKLPIAFAALLLIPSFVAVSTKDTSAAVMYCQHVDVDYPAGCVVKPGVVLRPRPVAGAAAREAVRPGTPMNRGGRLIVRAGADGIACRTSLTIVRAPMYI